MRAKEFAESLQSVALDNVFNPYADRCPVHDLEDAPRRRRDSLEKLLDVANGEEIDSLWIGRDLGYRGGRRTGLALTDDVHIREHAARWNLAIARATNGPPVAERTAAIIWSMLRQVRDSVFLWNVFPFHPYEPSAPFTNRSHNSRERKIGEDLLWEVIEMLRPRRLIALGNDAANSASRLGAREQVINVRHPSYGGQRLFILQIREVYGLGTAD